jgi:hypothetical protein
MKMVELDLNEPPPFTHPGACHQVVLGKIRGTPGNVDAGRPPVRDRYGPACRLTSTWAATTAGSIASTKMQLGMELP